MKQKLYTEEEIFEIIDSWANEENENRDLKKFGFLAYDEKIDNLKHKFMTPQGFRKALEESGLGGTQF